MIICSEKKLKFLFCIYKILDSYFKRQCGVVDEPLALYPGVPRAIPDLSSLSDETLSCGPDSPYEGLKQTHLL